MTRLPLARGAATAPTLAEVHGWPATVDVAQAGRAFGVSKSHAYALLDRGEFPAKAIRVGGRWRVLTSSIVSVLSGESTTQLSAVPSSGSKPPTSAAA